MVGHQGKHDFSQLKDEDYLLGNPRTRFLHVHQKRQKKNNSANLKCSFTKVFELKELYKLDLHYNFKKFPDGYLQRTPQSPRF